MDGAAQYKKIIALLNKGEGDQRCEFVETDYPINFANWVHHYFFGFSDSISARNQVGILHSQLSRIKLTNFLCANGAQVYSVSG